MSDFDKDDWMADHGLRTGKAWIATHGRKPHQEFCDIIRKDGEEIGPCWPRSTDFVDLSGDDEVAYAFSDVTHVRYYDDAVSKDDDEDDEDGEDEDEV